MAQLLYWGAIMPSEQSGFASWGGTGIMSGFWDRIDKIYCISVDTRTDRRIEAGAQFELLGIQARVEFVVVPKHPTDCEQGIYESHLQCMQMGLAAGARRILIFEDDVIFDRVEGRTLDRLAGFVDRHQGWHMLFLGCMVSGSRRSGDPSVRRIKYRSLTHAYVVHRDFAAFVLQHPWRGIPYDDFLRDLRDDGMYAAYPAIAFQSNSPSDNARYLRLDRFRRLCGGLRILQKQNEFYHRHRLLIIGGHVLALLMLLQAL
ncbi:LPS glycosyltransferase [Desulfosarcina cetonica]|nr:LPS glycosyltransferase [Desulfosarcina cetonica]